MATTRPAHNHRSARQQEWVTRCRASSGCTAGSASQLEIPTGAVRQSLESKEGRVVEDLAAASPGRSAVRSHLGLARARSSHPAGWPGTQAPAPSAAACQPGNRTASLLPVHKHVDDLCATAPSLCIRSGNAGDSAAWPQP